jgi:enamine deaminase RidA (YjgF/YER057c/UK114 family)
MIRFYIYLSVSMLFIQCSSPKVDLYSYDVEQRIAELGIELQELKPSQNLFVNANQVGNLVFMSGKISRRNDGSLVTGKLGMDLSVQEGANAARLAAIQQLDGLKAHIGDLNKVVRIVKVLGMVNSAPDFTDQPAVMNGFSQLMIDVFGERGKHARSAVGMSALPANAAVEVEMIVEVQTTE